MYVKTLIGLAKSIYTVVYMYKLSGGDIGGAGGARAPPLSKLGGAEPPQV